MSRLYINIYAFSLILFGLLCYFAHQFLYLPSDIAISLWLQGFIPPSLDPTMQAVSYISSLIPATVIVVLLAGGLCALGKKLEPIFIVTLPSLAVLLSGLLKLLISRPRPSSELIQLLGENNGFSFPSGHVTHAIVFYGFLFYLVPRLVKQPAVIRTLQSLLGLLILLTAVSRLYLGAHWSSDVFGSFFLGGLILAPAIILYRNFVTGTKEKSGDKDA